MWAIVEFKGFQFYIEEKNEVIVPFTGFEEGEKFTMDKVLLLSKDGNITVGKPNINAVVEARVISNLKGKKIEVFKMKRRKKYRKRKGHRQKWTKIFVEKIKTKGEK